MDDWVVIKEEEPQMSRQLYLFCTNGECREADRLRSAVHSQEGKGQSVPLREIKRLPGSSRRLQGDENWLPNEDWLFSNENGSYWSARQLREEDIDVVLIQEICTKINI